MSRFVLVLAASAALAACGSESPPPAAEQPDQAAPTPAAPPPAAPAAYTGPVIAKEALGGQVCYFTPDEIAEKLGFTVQPGVADTAMLQSYGMASCVYNGSNNSLRVTAIWIDPAQLAAARSGMTRMSGGGMVEIVPGDPDAAYLHDQQDNGSSLHYLRQNVRIQLHVTSSRVPFAAMKPKLLSLRRVP